MTDHAARLAKCFTTVFPELPPEQVHTAGTSNVREWDSLHHITLMTVIEEEFETAMPLENLDDLSSYQGILNFLNQKP